MSNNKLPLCEKNGWILIDKPSGLSSAKVVSKVKKFLNVKKAGHAGTLDPFATGLLPVAIGEATKTMSLIINSKKEYSFTVLWGKETDTDDSEGNVIKQYDIIPKEEDIKDILKKFSGNIEQIPPNFSSIKINGERAYNLARKHFQSKKSSLKLDFKIRKVFVYELKLLNHKKYETEFKICCSKGTYVRALARDMGRTLGTVAHVSQLKRLTVGNFNIKNSISLDFLVNLKHKSKIKNLVLPIMEALDDILVLKINKTESVKLKFGQKLKLERNKFKDILTSDEVKVLLACYKNIPVALIKIADNYIQPIRVFNIN